MEGLSSGFSLVGIWMTWKIGDGKFVRVAKEPWAEDGSYYKLSEATISQLKKQTIEVLAYAQAQVPQEWGRRGWNTQQAQIEATT